MFSLMRLVTVFGFAMMALGVIPANMRYSDGPKNHMYADDQSMTDEEYAAWMNLYTPPSPQTPTSANPGMTDEEYAAWMNLYTGFYPQSP